MTLEAAASPAPRLLVVDDEAVQRLIVARAAANLGIAADGAATLAEAVERVQAVDYDVVVLDLALRDHDGIELLRSLREAGVEAVLMFVSGFDERVRQAAARLAAALGLRVAGTLGKPLLVDRLVALLRALPERTRARRAEETADDRPRHAGGGDRRRRDHLPVPAQGDPAGTPPGRGRGAVALAQPGAGPGAARPLHPAGRARAA